VLGPSHRDTDTKQELMGNIAQDNMECLHQAMELLDGLSAEKFRHREKYCFNSTIGGHLRHNIDHYRSFLEGFAAGQVNYDHRERDARLEEDPQEAVQAIREILDGLQKIDDAALDTAVKIRMDSGGEVENCWSSSTIRRELQFLLSHSIHHYALIATICQLQGIHPQASFGVAPSTLRYKAQMASASQAN
jgi:uncharacterized damage-inducible protein DinB